jgi:tetratricopeptide (TPR) repeat protein
MAALIFLALRQKSKNKSSLAAGAKASLAAILVLMCVSYPFNLLPVYLYFVFCLAIIFYDSSHTGFYLKIKRITVIQWLVCLLAALIFAAGVRNLYGVRQLRKGQQYVFANQPDKGVEHYEKAAMILKNSGIFHFYYGSALALTKQYEASAKELEASIMNAANPNSYILLGNVYKELGRTEDAKQAYLTVIYMTPSKLFPKYLLAKLLADAAEPEEAAKWAREILDTKEKIPTTAAKEIKEEMKQLIHSIENKHNTK